jgi:tetratricopeptide (TPR) repeat protein
MMSSTARSWRLCLLLVLGCLAGCAGNPHVDMNSPERNAVLNYMRAGLAAMDRGDRASATASFDEALLRVEAVYANSERAARARSLWYEEGMKNFKGEPYERAMVFYYRGLLYLMEADYENARACFKSGVLQDAFAEESQNRCDFALLIFLEGWASQLNGDDVLADSAYKVVEELRPGFVRPAADHNFLAIAETGKAPRKLSDGIGHYELKLFRGKGFCDAVAKLTVDSRQMPMCPIEDIAWQAMTRGGRPVDHILKGQAVFKQTHARIGSAVAGIGSSAVVAAPLFDAASDVQGIGAALGLIGVAQMFISQRANVRADTRCWDNLPDTVHVITRRRLKSASVAATFADRRGSAVFPVVPVIVQTDSKGNSLGWIRSRSATGRR